MERGTSEINVEGVETIPLKIIEDERGAVMHMLRNDSPVFAEFGEVYFSEVKSGVIKGWKKHQVMTQHYAVPRGKIALVVYDDRPDSATRGETQLVSVGRDCYQLVKIPPRVWYGFKGISQEDALIVNCASHPHDPSEAEGLPLDSPPSPDMLTAFEQHDGAE